MSVTNSFAVPIDILVMYQFMTSSVSEHYLHSDPASPSDAVPSEAVRIRRANQRAAYDRATIDAILDDGLVAHVGTIRDGKPVVIPMFYVRDGDALLIHGAPASGAIRRAGGTEVCVTVTLLDGLVLARSAFHHSVNYRSVVVYGRGEVVSDPVERQEALRLTVEHAIPGRWDDVRPPNREEDLRTLVVRVPLDEASAKIRMGDPVDDDEDHALDCWAGVIPLHTAAQPPVDDGLLRGDIAAPGYAVQYRRPTRGN